MSQDPDESGEKSHEPTEKKLADARKRGEIPKSTDLTTAAVYAGFLLLLILFGGTSLLQLGASLSIMLEQADSLSTLWFTEAGGPLSFGLGLELAAPLSLWLGLPAMAALLATVVQRALVFAPDKLQPKLNRISPLSNAKNKFGRGGLFEFAKSAAKLTIYSVVLGVFLYRQMPIIVATSQFAASTALAELGRLAVQFLSLVLVVALSLGVIDFLWQHQEHRRKNMMSRKELIDEMKQSEGDPHVKQQRRQRAQEIAMNSMLSDIPKADVIIVNPQHYAVALSWARTPGSAPTCIAKGVDEIAARIRELAADASIPIHRDPPTARALYATIRIGQEIHPEHYQAVAAAIRFAEALRAKARSKPNG